MKSDPGTERGKELPSFPVLAGWVKSDPGRVGAGVGAIWETAGVAAAEVGSGVAVVVLSGAASTVVEVLAAVVGGANVGGVTTEEEGAGVGATAAEGGAVAAIAAAAVAAAAAASSAAVPGGTKALSLVSTTGSAGGCFSGGGVGSVVCGGALISSEGPARRLLKDTGNAEEAELGWGAVKLGFGFGSGGLNRLPEDAPLDKSEPAETSGAIWSMEPKLNCATPLPTANP